MDDVTRRPNAVRRPSPASSLCFLSLRDRGETADETRYYALDAEMVTVAGPGELPARRAMVSIGVVNERLETLLHCRVAVPDGCEVVDGTFARMEGGLRSSWVEGMPASCVSDFLERHAAAGGVLVGWEIHNDLAVTGFERAAHEVRSGARESLSAERTPIDVGDFPGKTSQEPRTGKNACSPASSPPPAEAGAARVALAAGSNGAGGSRGFRSNGDHGGRSFPPEPPPEEGKNVASPGGRSGSGDDPRHTSGDRWIGEGTAPKVDELKKKGDSGSRGRGVLGEERDERDGATGGLEEGRTPPERREEGAARAGGGSMRVVEVTDLFRTTKGLKCTLSEAYTCCFGRVEEGSHNAAVDARMTMELHNLWRRAGQPEQPFGLPLAFFVVNFHSFQPSSSRHATLWGVLRPTGIGGGGHGAIEKDSGSNTYKLSFRSSRDREAYLSVLERKMSCAGLKWQGDRQFVPGKRGAGDGYQVSCGRFKMHVLEHER